MFKMHVLCHALFYIIGIQLLDLMRQSYYFTTIKTNN